MHEIGVLNEVLKTAEAAAAENNISSIKFISLEVGELSGYLPVFFEKYFPVLIEDKPIFENCELKMTIERGEGLCTDCHSLYNIMKQEGKCPKCGSRNKTVLSGKELKLKQIGVDA